jgi:hypothetical protein
MAVPALKFTLTVRTPATRSRVRRTRGGQEMGQVIPSTRSVTRS